MNAVDAQLSLAEISLEEGHPEPAAALVRSALPVLEVSNVPDDETSADLLLCRILLAQGRTIEAGRAISRAQVRAFKSQGQTE